MTKNELKNQTDSDLINLYKNGCNKAFDCLYQRHYQVVYRYLRNLARNKETAEDLAHDVFLSFLVAFKENKFIGINDFQKYLISVSYNAFLYHRRIYKEIVTEDDYLFENIICESDNVQKLLIKKELEHETKTSINTLVAKLPKRNQEVIYLHIYKNRVLANIANEYSISEQTIKSRYFSSIEKLKLSAKKSNLKFAI